MKRLLALTALLCLCASESRAATGAIYAWATGEKNAKYFQGDSSNAVAAYNYCLAHNPRGGTIAFGPGTSTTWLGSYLGGAQLDSTIAITNYQDVLVGANIAFLRKPFAKNQGELQFKSSTYASGSIVFRDTLDNPNKVMWLEKGGNLVLASPRAIGAGAPANIYIVSPTDSVPYVTFQPNFGGDGLIQSARLNVSNKLNVTGYGVAIDSFRVGAAAYPGNLTVAGDLKVYGTINGTESATAAESLHVGSALTGIAMVVEGCTVFWGKVVVQDSLRVGREGHPMPLNVTGTLTAANITVPDSIRANKGIYVGGQLVNKILRASATLDFDLIAATCHTLTMAVDGAADGDAVFVGAPNGSIVSDETLTAWVSATNTVSIRACDGALTGNPASGTYRVTVIK